jgi:type IV pilus assembly protein PilW
VNIAPHLRARAQGFTLIELMIAMVLGMVVIGGVMGVFLALMQNYRTNNSLSEVQGGARLVFEMLARDIRSAQLTGCHANGRIVNVLANGNAGSSNNPAWWADWVNPFIGYKNAVDPALTIPTGPGARVAGTDSIRVLRADDSSMIVAGHTTAVAASKGSFTVDGGTGSLRAGDIIIVCNPAQSAILQTDGVTTGTAAVPGTITYSLTGNCTTALDWEAACGQTAASSSYTYGPSSEIAPLYAVDWYIGSNPVGGRSLYRMTLANTNGAPAPVSQEMVRNVTNMALTYLMFGATQFVTADNVTDWPSVNAVQLQLTMQSIPPGTTPGTPPANTRAVTRSYNTAITLYTRVN